VTGVSVVLGASGGTGRAVVAELAARGLPVRAVNRRGNADAPSGVERVAADITTAEGAASACAGAAVVYHCAQPAYTRWAAEFPAMNETVIAAAAAAGAKLVFADNLYAYGPLHGPISEDTPQQPSSRKGRVRLALTRRLLEAHRDGRLRVAIGRSSDYYGPGGVDSVAGRQLFEPVLAGRPVPWPGDPDQPRTLHFLGDMARGLVTLGSDDRADGQIWILPAAPPLTPREFIALAAEVAGTRCRVRRVSRTALRLAGLFVAPARELPDIWYQYVQPFTVDASRFEATFGPATVTPHADALSQTLTWYRRTAAG